MSLNLDPIAAVVEQYMLDTVQVYEITGRTFNESTSEYTDTELTIYTGKAFIGPMGTPGRTDVGTAEQPSRMMYEMGLPRANEDGTPVTGIKREQYVRVLTSKYNPAMVGNIFRVDGQVDSTFHVHRRVTLRRDTSRHES